MSYLRTKLPESLPAETVREPWRKALLDAAQYMRVHGHCRNGLATDDSGAVCAIAAIRFGGAWGRAGNDALEQLREHLAGRGKYTCIPIWSDTHTKAEVIAALEGAARSALREGG